MAQSQICRSPCANLGYALARQGKIADAISYFETALKINPNYYEAHSNLGMILARQGRLEEAIAHFSEALRIYPDYASARQNPQESLAGKQQLSSSSNQA